MRQILQLNRGYLLACVKKWRTAFSASSSSCPAKVEFGSFLLCGRFIFYPLNYALLVLVLVGHFLFGSNVSASSLECSSFLSPKSLAQKIVTISETGLASRMAKSFSSLETDFTLPALVIVKEALRLHYGFESTSAVTLNGDAQRLFEVSRGGLLTREGIYFIPEIGGLMLSELSSSELGDEVQLTPISGMALEDLILVPNEIMVVRSLGLRNRSHTHIIFEVHHALPESGFESHVQALNVETGRIESLGLKPGQLIGYGGGVILSGEGQYSVVGGLRISAESKKVNLPPSTPYVNQAQIRQLLRNLNRFTTWIPESLRQIQRLSLGNGNLSLSQFRIMMDQFWSWFYEGSMAFHFKPKLNQVENEMYMFAVRFKIKQILKLAREYHLEDKIKDLYRIPEHIAMSITLLDKKLLGPKPKTVSDSELLMINPNLPTHQHSMDHPRQKSSVVGEEQNIELNRLAYERSVNRILDLIRQLKIKVDLTKEDLQSVQLVMTQYQAVLNFMIKVGVSELRAHQELTPVFMELTELLQNPRLHQAMSSSAELSKLLIDKYTKIKTDRFAVLIPKQY